MASERIEFRYVDDPSVALAADGSAAAAWVDNERNDVLLQVLEPNGKPRASIGQQRGLTVTRVSYGEPILPVLVNRPTVGMQRRFRPILQVCLEALAMLMDEGSVGIHPHRIGGSRFRVSEVDVQQRIDEQWLTSD
jgi:hypothetical protein